MEKIKSNSWVGNIYHKFESICQEVDEFVTKDTVKYVENQVQTVGEGMKKLYSGMVPDFLIPADDRSKKEAQAVNGKQNYAVDTHTSPVTGTTQNPIKEQSSLDWDAENSLQSHNASTAPDGAVASEVAELDFSVGNDSASVNCKSSGKDLGEDITMEEELVDEESSSSEDGISSESCSESSSDVSITHLILQDGIPSEDQLAPKESSSARDENLPQTPAVASDIPQDDAGVGASMTVCNSSLHDVSCVSDKSSTTLAFEDTPPSTFESSELVLPRVLLENESVDVDTGISKSSLSAESPNPSTSSVGNSMQEEESDYSISTGLSSSSSFPLVNTNSGIAVIPALSRAALLTDFSDINTSSSDESVGNAGSIKNDLEWCRSPQLKALMGPAEIGCINDCCADLPGMETIDLTDKGKLEESCVLVDNKLHTSVSFRPRKYKSYKELIQEAFASRKRLIKEYKQLAVLYADIDVETSKLAELSQAPSLPSPCLHSTDTPVCSICESGWELL